MRYLLCLLIVAWCGSRAWAEEDYVPLALGTQWTMTLTDVSPKGQTTSGTYREAITGTVKMNGHKYFRLEQSVKWKSPAPKVDDVKRATHIALVRKTPSAYYSTEQTGTGLKEGVIYQLPLKSGVTQNVNWASKNRNRKITILGKETINVSGHTYKDCYHVRVVYAVGNIRNLWLAPGIGRVLVKTVYPDGYKTTFALAEYKAGK
jgi:hypothetical protein